MKDLTQPAEPEKLSKLQQYYHDNPGALERRRALYKAHYEANKKSILEKSKQYYANNPSIRERARTRNKAHYEANKAQIKTWRQAYNKRNNKRILQKQQEYILKRLSTDELYYVKFKLRQATYRAFKRMQQNKSIATEQLLGCSWQEAKEHFERLFQPGMNWSNHGKWHIDHIKPIANATTIEEATRLSHISNLQPLWAADNQVKGARNV